MDVEQPPAWAQAETKALLMLVRPVEGVREPRFELKPVQPTMLLDPARPVC